MPTRAYVEDALITEVYSHVLTRIFFHSFIPPLAPAESEGGLVSVSRADDETFTLFFSSTVTTTTTSTTQDDHQGLVDGADFDAMSMLASQL